MASGLLLKTALICMAAGLSMNLQALSPSAAPAPAAPAAQAARPSPGDSSGFVVLSEVAPDIIQEIRYFSTYNFVGDRIDGYREPCALMTRAAARALAAVSDDVKQMGYRLKVFDAYRPAMAVDHFVRWAKAIEDTRMKSFFYPALNKSVLFKQGYIAEKSGHSRGSTVDLTLFDMRTGKEVDMGGTFDYFGRRSHPDFKGDLTAAQLKNRMTLRKAMMRRGFKPLSTEWWHFTLENEPYPDTYFTFTSERLPALAAKSPSPDWVAALPAARDAKQLFVVAGIGKTTAWVSLHEKDASGKWVQVVTTPGFIGREGLGKTKEGDAKTPVGTYRFNRAFGIAENPGTRLPYVRADENTYWSGDQRPGMKYNELVDARDFPGLNKEESEHITDYFLQYQYCLNISYNESGTPGLGSAIFLHCLGANKPYTGGCVAIPMDKMQLVMQRVDPECAVVIDTLENLGGKF